MSKLKAVILAAGKGTRMESDLPKVLHCVKNKPMVKYSIDAARMAGAEEICVIVGYKGEMVADAIKDENVVIAEQKEQLGTGHAVKCARDFIGTEGSTLILCGDTPLVRPETLSMLADCHEKNGNSVTVLSAIFEDPTGYGRIIRDSEGDFLQITEQKDCTEEQKLVKEINSGMYLYDSKALYDALIKITNENAQHEYYLTDTIELIKKAGMRVGAISVEDKREILGVNTKVQLAEAEEIMSER